MISFERLDVRQNWSRLSEQFFRIASGAQVPLSAVARIKRSTAPLAVNHQGPFPAVTITYNLTAETPIELATNAIRAAVAEMHLPRDLRVRPKTSSWITKLSHHEADGREFQEREGIAVEIFPVLCEVP